MPIRAATYSDLLPASKCLARAFKDEALFGVYMHPRRDQFPDDVYLQFLHRLRDGWASGPDNHFLVSYLQAPDGTEQITGFAHWKRMRANPQTTVVQKVTKTAMNWYNYLESFIYPNRALEPRRAAILGQIGPFAGHLWSGSRAEVWDLVLLGVDPSYSGTGQGRELVAWGFERAKEEGIGCSVISAEGVEPFYQRCGFDKIVGSVAEHGGETNPFIREKIPGGTILFWDNGRDISGVKGYGEQ